MVALLADMPDGVEYSIVYDPTRFVQASIDSVIHTLLAVPVSIVGTFSLMLLFGFSINALSLFGMVLAIGIVVDDAIVVVENVERNIAEGLSPKQATYKAMPEVSGPIIAIALTLVAVFVPLAAMSGLSGEFYKQFVMTIAISTVISAFNLLTRAMNKVLGGFFRSFNPVFQRGSEAYGKGVGGVVRHKGAMLLVYVLLLGLTFVLGRAVPGGFVSAQDKEYLIAFAQVPTGASLDRTEEVIRNMTDIALKQPGVDHAVAFPGLSVNGFTNSSSAGMLGVTLFGLLLTPVFYGPAALLGGWPPPAAGGSRHLRPSGASGSVMGDRLSA